ncbi:hypothetical protein AC578_5034 [Pseudocercospora eumusae]|uniref:Uncharacterized protein n=1 Tax=Pseudocercospora eumusae TaxID=321146 RepID=A0A139H692_9PEZI|nr:hypothetical protein AC578_5034 [Pseudocercospora eumusae]KXS97879.1 hypothetical protein AC578_5034 [Pseudocercospora eumusae]
MAVEMEAPSTPPRRTRAHLDPPPTPLHGAFLDSPPRRSTRSTLNPYSSANVSASSSFKSSATSSLPPVTPKTAARKLSFAVSDALSTPPASPMQARLGAITGHADNSLDDDNSNAQGDHKTLAAPSSTKSAMLPTPSKTPSLTPARKRQRAASLQDTARVLHFQPENPNDAMPSPQQSRKHKAILASKTGAFDLDADKPKRKGKGNDFSIYTETQARVPEVDKSSDNVFRGRTASSAPPARERARQWDSSPSPPPRSRRSAQDLYDEQRMESAAKHEQGIVYTFRGRKVYKKFEDVDGPDLGESSRQRALKRAAGDTRPITHSNITPRLLWARQNSDRDIDEGEYIRQHDTADEEAETDIDMSDAPAIHVQEVESSVLIQHATPAKTKARSSSKPLMSPPTTSRTTRTKQHNHIPSFDDTLDADDEGAAAVLPTPQRSSRKKKVTVNDMPVYIEGTPEPMSMTPDGKDDPPAPTPARSRTKRVQIQLTPVIEDEEPASAECAGSPQAGRRKARSPFDNWPRTKAGRKREVAAVEDSSSAAPTKRSRSGTRSARA